MDSVNGISYYLNNVDAIKHIKMTIFLSGRQSAGAAAAL